MLSEEEQAVENLEKLVKLRKNIRGEITHDTCICGTSDLDTGLKLINKLKKENEELSVKNIENICRGVEEEVLQEYRDKITKLQKENEEKDKKIKDLEFALLDMVMQFANRIKTKGSSYALDTMGLSSLELAFNELGFYEMYPVNKAEEKYKILEKKYYGN